MGRGGNCAIPLKKNGNTETKIKCPNLSKEAFYLNMIRVKESFNPIILVMSNQSCHNRPCSLLYRFSLVTGRPELVSGYAKGTNLLYNSCNLLQIILPLKSTQMYNRKSAKSNVLQWTWCG